MQSLVVNFGGELKYLKVLQALGAKNFFLWMVIAAQHGDLEVVRYLCKRHSTLLLSVDAACTAAAEHGHLNCLKFSYETHKPTGWRCKQFLCESAARGGNLDCFTYLYKTNASMRDSKGYLRVAINAGSAKIVEYVLHFGVKLKRGEYSKVTTPQGAQLVHELRLCNCSKHSTSKTNVRPLSCLSVDGVEVALACVVLSSAVVMVALCVGSVVNAVAGLLSRQVYA